MRHKITDNACQDNGSVKVSFDVKLLLSYLASACIIRFIPYINPRQRLIIVSVIVAVCVSVTSCYRHRYQWKWAGVSRRHLLWALAVLMLFVIMVTGGDPAWWFDSEYSLTYFCWLGSTSFISMYLLRLVYLDQGSSLAACSGNDFVGVDPVRELSKWLNLYTIKGVIRTLIVLMLVAWITHESRASHYSISAIRHASLLPAGERLVPHNEHGTIIYITQAEQSHIDRDKSIDQCLFVGCVVIFLAYGLKSDVLKNKSI